MTWADARKDAERMLRAIPLQIDRALAAGETITLPFFETQETLDLFQPESRWTLAYHQQVTGAARRLLLKRKTDVRLAKITVADYRTWLADRDDTPQARAAFLAERTRD